MLVINENSILLAVIGSVGVIGSVIVMLYSFNRQQKFEKSLAVQRRRAVAEAAAEDNKELLMND